MATAKTFAVVPKLHIVGSGDHPRPMESNEHDVHDRNELNAP
jgi:hypothetical protein